MNRHPPFLGVLGILPNQLRTLLKESRHEHREDALLDLSRTLFFAGFRIWTKKQTLAKLYWNNVGNLLKKITLRKKGRKPKKYQEAKTQESNCKNPFHYLHRHDNLSQQRPTRCPCRNVVSTKTNINQSLITVFVRTYNKEKLSSLSELQQKKEVGQSIQENSFMTLSDIIRSQHDRGKKRNLQQLTLHVTAKKKKNRTGR